MRAWNIMQTNTFISHLICSQCENSFDHRALQTFCQTCNKPLLAVYDLERAKARLHQDDISRRRPDLWRYQELLPVENSDHIVTLGEGFTPLVPLKELGNRFGFTRLWMKDDSQIPTGSFKARGLSVAVSKAVELGITKTAIPSAGNAAGALAAYAARAGIECFIFMPRDVPRINRIESEVTGAHVGESLRQSKTSCSRSDSLVTPP